MNIQTPLTIDRLLVGTGILCSCMICRVFIST